MINSISSSHASQANQTSQHTASVSAEPKAPQATSLPPDKVTLKSAGSENGGQGESK